MPDEYTGLKCFFKRYWVHYRRQGQRKTLHAFGVRDDRLRATIRDGADATKLLNFSNLSVFRVGLDLILEGLGLHAKQE